MKIRINRKNAIWTILFFIIALFVFRVPYFQQLHRLVSYLYYYGLNSILFIMVIMTVSKFRRIQIKGGFIYSFIVIWYFGIIYLSAYINKQPFSTFNTMFSQVIVTALLLNSFGKTKLKQLVDGYAGALLLITVSNTLSAILFPNALYADADGHYVCFLLGHDNASINVYLLCVGVCMVRAYIKNARVDLCLVVSIVSITVFSFIRETQGGIVCSIVLILAFSLYLLKNYRLKAVHVLYSMLAVFLFMVVFQGFLNYDYYVQLYFNRSATLSGRTLIWSKALGMIWEKPILGYGNYFSSTLADVVSISTSITAHNTYLTNMLAGGILLMVPFVTELIIVARQIDEENSVSTTGLSIALLVLLLHGQIEGSDSVYILIYLVLLGYSLCMNADLCIRKPRKKRTNHE